MNEFRQMALNMPLSMGFEAIEMDPNIKVHMDQISVWQDYEQSLTQVKLNVQLFAVVFRFVSLFRLWLRFFFFNFEIKMNAFQSASF